MPQTRTDIKLTDTLEEVLQPIKEAMQKLVSNQRNYVTAAEQS